MFDYYVHHIINDGRYRYNETPSITSECIREDSLTVLLDLVPRIACRVQDRC